jgi:hypothetical protein
VSVRVPVASGLLQGHRSLGGEFRLFVGQILFLFLGMARVCVGIFDEHPFTSRPMDRNDRGAEGHRTDMATH